jgi:hypothetical protein
MNATPTTPTATERMVAVVSRCSLGPFVSPESLVMIRSTAALPEDPYQKHEHGAHGRGSHAEHLGGQPADLRLHGLDEGGKIRRRLGPGGVNPLADQGPIGHGRRRRLNGYRPSGDRLIGHLNVFGEQTAKQDDRATDQDQTDAHQQAGGQPLAPARPTHEGEMQRVEGDRENRTPHHHAHEGRKNPEAEDHQHDDDAGPDQHLHQLVGCQLLSGRGIIL